MASASEGKVLLPPDISKICQGCEINDTVMYCKDCPMALCTLCSTPHQKVQATRDHELVTLICQSIPRSAEAPSLDISCVKHPSSQLSSVCRNCEEAICDICKKQHSGHKVLPAKNDFTLLRQIAMGMITKLLDQVRDLDTKKQSAMACVTLFNDAKLRIEKWRVVIVECTNKNADALQSELDKKIAAVKQHFTSIVDLAERTDHQITKLNDIRRGTDTDVLMAVIGEAGHILTEKSSSPVTKVGKTVGAINSKSRAIDEVTQAVEQFFNIPLTDGAGDRKPLINYMRLQQREKEVVSHDSYLAFCDQEIGGDGSFTMYSGGSTAVWDLTVDPLRKTRSSSKVKLCWPQLVRIAHDKFVSRDVTKPDIYLLDNNFKIIDTLTFKQKASEFEFRFIGYYDQSSCLKCDMSSSKPRQLIFNKILIHNDKFKKQEELAKVQIDDYPLLMKLQNNRSIVILVSASALYQVDLGKSTVLKIDHYRVTQARSVSVDEHDNILIGDDEGSVHVFTPQMVHNVVLNVGSPVWGIVTHSKKLIVSCGNNRPTIAIFS